MSSADTTKPLRRRRTHRGLEPATLILGRSVDGRPIPAYHFPGGHETILVLGGFHGDEPKSVYVAQRLIETLARRNGSGAASCDDICWVIVPIVNPDGYERRKRRNANHVDLNRNFPAQNWTLGNPRSRMFGGRRPASEPETRAVIRAVERFAPHCIITIHSIDRNRLCNNYDGPGKRIAQAMHRINHYPVTASIGYPTPGSFGTWAGAERGIPTITLELPSHHSAKRCWEDNSDALLYGLS